MIIGLKKIMHVFVLIFILAIQAAGCASAQDQSVNQYSPPPMFGGAEPREEPASAEPQSPNLLDLINLDSITGRILDEPHSVQETLPAKAFKPPLPPKRPTAFQVSQDYLNRITAPVSSAMPSEQDRPAAPLISPPALAGDALNADLRKMDAIDIYKNIDSGAQTDKAFINIPSIRTQAMDKNHDYRKLSLAFASDATDLTRRHIKEIDQNIVPLLRQHNFNGLTIEAFAGEDTRQRRASLSRAIAVRNYLENKGFKRADISINQQLAGETVPNEHALTIRPSQ